MRFGVGQALVRVLGRLGNIPGLRFLHGYVTSAQLLQTRFGQRKGDYEGYINMVKDSGQEARDAFGRTSSADAADDDDSGDSQFEDDSEYVDYYDLYDGPGGPQSGGAYEPVDDYPDSDENTSYFDDDYRR